MPIPRLSIAQHLNRVREFLAFGIASDNPDEMEALSSTENALHVMDRSGHIDRTWGVANVLPGPFPLQLVAAGSTDTVLGATGDVGDILHRLVIVPGANNCGAVSIKDGAGADVEVFAGGGTTALADLSPIAIELNVHSLAGAWQVTTGANVSVVALGLFTA